MPLAAQTNRVATTPPLEVTTRTLAAFLYSPLPYRNAREEARLTRKSATAPTGWHRKPRRSADARRLPPTSPLKNPISQHSGNHHIQNSPNSNSSDYQYRHENATSERQRSHNRSTDQPQQHPLSPAS